MHHVKSSPPFAPLRACVGRLERAGLVVALGGSGLLAGLGLADHVRDWDLTTDEPLERVRAALAGEPLEIRGHDALHADHKVVLEAANIEVIVRFAFHAEGGVVRIPTLVTDRWQGIPVGSAEAWSAAYWLLGRVAKAEMLLAYLDEHGAERAIIERLLGEPLPRDLAARLRTLPQR